MIKAVIFDYGGVCKAETEDIIVKDIAKSCKIPYSAAKNAEEELKPLYETGMINDPEYWRRFQLITKCVLPKNCLSLWTRKYGGSSKKIKATLAMVRKLKKNYDVAVLSDTVPPHERYNEERENYHIFDYVFLSTQMRMKKPNPKVFRHVLKTMGIKANEAVFIDDRKINADAAEKLGIHSILFKSPLQAEKALRKLGLDF